MIGCCVCSNVDRTREDTVRQIVGSLTGDAEGCSDLANELSRADPVTLETQDSEDEGSDPDEWTPDPTDALTGLKPGNKYYSQINKPKHHRNTYSSACYC